MLGMWGKIAISNSTLILTTLILAIGLLSNSFISQAHADASEMDAVGCIGEYEYWDLLGTTDFYKMYGQDEEKRLCVSLFEKGKVPQELEDNYVNSEAGIQIEIPENWIGYEVQMEDSTWVFLEEEKNDPKKTVQYMFFSIMDLSKSNNIAKELSDLGLRNALIEPSYSGYCRTSPGKIVHDMNGYELHIECSQPGTQAWDILSYAYLTDRNIISATWVGVLSDTGDFDFRKSQAINDLSFLSIENQRDISNIFGTPKPDEPIIKTQIPDWIRNNAEWWAQGAIGDSDFVSGIQYLIKQKIMQIPPTVVSDSEDETKNKSVSDQGYIEVNGREFFVSRYNPASVTLTGKVEEDQYKVYCDFSKPGEYYDESISILVARDGTFHHEMLFNNDFKEGEYNLDCKYKNKDFGSLSFSLTKSTYEKTAEKEPKPEKNLPEWIKNNAEWWSQGLISDDDFVKGIQYLVEQGIIRV